ncbi:MAG: sensor histidine kinase [Clostridia bacterium]
MTYRKLKGMTILLPPTIIGGFEFIRHDFLLRYLSMEAGNYYITILTLLLSYIFATWMFKKIERMNARLAEEQTQRAVYEERERLARELHDNIAQSLFLLNVKLKRQDLAEARNAVAEIDNNVRQAIFNLRSSPQEGVALSARIGKWLGEWSVLTGIEVATVMEGIDGFFTPAEEVQLFGIIQESFTNIRKHSGAKQAKILLRADGTNWKLWIADNGQGGSIPAEEARKYGLSMIQERADKLEAKLVIQQVPGMQITLLGKKGGQAQ